MICRLHQEPDYEMYENEHGSPVHHIHHHHTIQHSHHHPPQMQTVMQMDVTDPRHPSYQNTAYTGSDAEPDCQALSSAPSSAYYSDLSSNSTNQQILSSPITTLHPQIQLMEAPPQYRLAAINESSVPSDYI